ncbi:MAG: amidohydrolase [Bacteroidales bacterium]
MKATLIQARLKWEDISANLEHISSLISLADSDTGLVVLPEMFTTAFSMDPSRLAETMEGNTVRWMKEKASSGGFAVCGSVIIREDNRFFNRMLFVTPDGDVTVYDKRHLHSMSGENTVYSRGNKRVIKSYLEFNFNLQICYDLRFPVWIRNIGDSDVIIFSSNWPAVRSNVWKSLLVARAIENQCYVIGVNRVGTNPDGTSYSGDSVIVNPMGETLVSLEPFTEGVVSAVLSRETIDRYRADMPVWRDADPFTLL